MKFLKFCRQCVTEFIDDDCPRMAAALAYYTIFSLPPILILLILGVGVFFDPADVRREITGQFRGLFGEVAASQVVTILEHARSPERGFLGSITGFAVLLFGATGAVGQLQTALNAVWNVAPDPKHGGIRNFLLKRLLSFGMIAGVGFLLLASLVVNAALAASAEYLQRMIPAEGMRLLLYLANTLISFGVITVLFAGIYKVLPDAQVAWRHVWMGAAVTSLLFAVGKQAIGMYLGSSSVGAAYGAAGTLAVVLVWVYYSSMIVLFGAEFTQVWAHRNGPRVAPEPNAVPSNRKPAIASTAE